MEVLKNFATINQTLLFPEGNTLVTRSVKKHTYAEATVTETFPKRFTVYDLNEFLSTVTFYEKPVLDFELADNYVVVSDERGGMASKFHYGDESLAYIPDPKKKIALPSTEVSLKLTEKDFKRITDIARIQGSPELSLHCDGKVLELVSLNSKNSSVNNTVLPIGKAPKKSVPFTFIWKIEYLKLIPGTYDLAVSKEGLSRFTHTEFPVTYHIVLEANGTKYGE